MAELGLASQSKPVSQVVGDDEVDRLMAEIGVSAAGNAHAHARPSPGPVAMRGRGVSSGPGGAWRGKSSGPGRGGLPAAGRAMPLAERTPDGRPIMHTGPPCAMCGEMVVGQILNALGKTYHPEHFLCVHCNNPFPPGQSFIEHEGQPYCETDFGILFCPRCNNCKQPILDKVVSAGSLKYHPHHFICTGCGNNLVGKTYKEEEGEIYCHICKGNRKQRLVGPPEMCGKCKRPILGEWITIQGMKVHAEHYRCEDCGCEFKGGNCHEWEGKYYCTECHGKLMRNACASCHKPILGRSVTALGKVWHPEHFVCFTCHEPFAGSNFYEKDNRPYCETHFTQLYGDPCNKCGRQVIHDACNFLDKVYHASCFLCTGCDKLLKKGDITAWDAKPMCFNCYKQLPTEVRKRAEKKRKEEEKIQKQREKEKANK
eukprot:TRINITY_DN4024_c0_g1_i1.p1 TRINITY_DN4024_c0_g1~~TRINITY_DN4024_c0_g1_i1.p1  ORF type:complete len:457 (+),score=98.77 TRINITY_DN4024_c0_g1_i1:89-1372(+)